MNAEARQAQDDLAYLRAIVAGGSWTRAFRSFGAYYLLAGVLYGAETLVHWAQSDEVLGLPPIFGIVAAIGATGIFLAAILWNTWRNRKEPQGGLAQRAFNAAFAATGLTNLAFVALFAAAAILQQSFAMWLLYPAVVFGLQGAAWLIAFMLQRRAWMLIVAFGWLGNAVVLGFLLTSPLYALAVAFGLIAWMAIPGAFMLARVRGG